MNTILTILISPFIFGPILALLATWKFMKGNKYRQLWRICSTLLWSGLALLFIGKMGTTLGQDDIIRELGIILPVGGVMFCIGLISFGILSLLNFFSKLASSKNTNS